MQNTKRSALLSLACVYGIALVFAGVEIAAPWLVNWYLAVASKGIVLRPLLLGFIYGALLPGGYALYLLQRMLRAIVRGNCFCAQNVSALRRLSWCAALLAVVSFVPGIWYLPFLFIAVAAAFMALLLRVIKNAFQSALELQTENEMTI